MRDLSDEEGEVLNELRSAFAMAFNDKSMQAGDHERWLQLRPKLSLLQHLDLAKVLPLILYDLLLTRPDNRIESEDSEFVIMQPRKCSKAAREEDPQGYKFVEGRFDSYTPKQAAAIYKWLLLARSWPVFETWQEDFEDALGFWLPLADSPSAVPPGKQNRRKTRQLQSENRH